MKLLGLVSGAAGLLWACTGQDVATGLDEPFWVRDAQFIKGDLPGNVVSADTSTDPGAPLVTSVAYKARIVQAGEPDVAFVGRTSTNGAALGLRLKGAGTGYWLVPVGAADFTNGGELQWNVAVSFSSDAPTGLENLSFVAIDARGYGGNQTELPICIVPAIPDNLNACDSKKQPPAVVVSLDWDTRVDLDLHIVTPEGKIVDSKHPSTATTASNGTTSPSPNDGILDTDSNAGCSSGPQRENIIWQKAPAPGPYLVYVNLFDSCGVASVRYNVSIHVSAPGEAPDTFKAVEYYHSSGSLMAVEANGGSQLGTFVTEFTAL